jgi:hypothetical protein
MSEAPLKHYTTVSSPVTPTNVGVQLGEARKRSWITGSSPVMTMVVGFIGQTSQVIRRVLDGTALQFGEG